MCLKQNVQPQVREDMKCGEAKRNETNDKNQEGKNLLNNYFASVFQKEEPTPLPQFNDRKFIQELNTISITEENILKGIDKIHPRGPTISTQC